MTPAFSTYLEGVRFAATLLVFVAHGLPLYQPFEAFAASVKLGRDGVVMFFVLSGYVISWCAVERESSAVSFAINRAARIYSVAVPGILLGMAVSLLFWSLGRMDGLEYPFRKLWLYLPLYLGFLGNHWYLSEVPPQNFPYWSLYFEVTYYLLFATFFYLRNRWRWPLVLALAAIVGPPILQLFPLWLLGSWLFFAGPKFRLSITAARVLLMASGLAFVLMKALAVDDALDRLHPWDWHALGLGTAQMPAQLAGDYGLGLVVALNLLAAMHARLAFRPAVEAALRWLASHSFSFYLFHIPLFALAAVICPDRQSFAQYLLAMGATAVLILLLARITEHRKSAWRSAFAQLAHRLGAARGLNRQS